jgi:hypothetical protein
MQEFNNPPPVMTITAPPHQSHRHSMSHDGSSVHTASNPNLQSPSSTISFFPTPSPAACGKRKHAELTAAAMLATVGTGPKDATARKSLNLKNSKNDPLLLNLEMDEEAGPSSTMEEYFRNNGQSLMNPVSLNNNDQQQSSGKSGAKNSDNGSNDNGATNYKTHLSSPKTGLHVKGKGTKVRSEVSRQVSLRRGNPD